MNARAVVATLIAWIVPSCGSVDVYPISNMHGSHGKTLQSDDSGIRFYRPAPHVWLTRAIPPDKVNTTQSFKKDTSTAGIEKAETVVVSNSGEGFQATLVMLPDFSREYVVQWSSGLGSVTPNLTLSDGWNLTVFNSTVNSAAAVESTVGKAITALGSVLAAGALTANSNFNGAGLYKLNVDSTGAYSLGAQVLPLE